jgi:hypothetical protein
MVPVGTVHPPRVSGSVTRRLNIQDGGQSWSASASTAALNGSVADGNAAAG